MGAGLVQRKGLRTAEEKKAEADLVKRDPGNLLPHMNLAGHREDS